MLTSAEVFQVLQQRISPQVPGGLGLAARGLGTGQEGRLQFHHQVMNSPGLHLCCLLLLCCLKSGSFWVLLRKEKCASSGGRGQVGYVGPWEGLSVLCTDLSLSLPPCLPESLLLQYLMLPVHGSFWGSEGKPTCFSWWPLGSRWAVLLLCGVGYAHPICLFVSLECVNIPDPPPVSVTLCSVIVGLHCGHPSAVTGSEARCCLHVKKPCLPG